MSIPMQLLLVVAAFCLCLSEGAPDGRIARAKQQRPTRGFKNLEMMTARGFGKRGRISPRTERDVQAQTPPERTYRATPTYKSPAQNYARDFGKRTPEMEPEGEIREYMPLERTYRVPTFESESKNNYARDFGKRTRMEQQGEFREQKPLRRTYRLPTFESSSKDNIARGYGKRTPNVEQGETEDQTPVERNLRTPTFKSSSNTYARDFGKRTPEMEQEGENEDEILPERTSRTTHVFKSAVQIGTARDFGKRTEDIEPEEPRRFNPKSSMMVATSFGKRSNDESTEEEEEYRSRRADFKPAGKVNVAVGYGKRKMPTKRVYGLDNFWETLAAPEREGQEMEDDKLESIPLDWFVNEIVNNPDFARSVVRKFVDINQDGMLSSDELLRSV